MASSLNPITTSSSFPLHSPSSLLPLLHLPELLIQLNPLVTSFHLLPSPSLAASSSSSEYSITDSVPLLFGYLSTSTTYTARFTSTPSGQIIDIKAGLGIGTTSVWKVEDLKGEGGSLVTESSQVSVGGGRIWSWLMKGFVEGQIKESHGVLMRRLREKADEESKTEGGEQQEGPAA